MRAFWRGLGWAAYAKQRMESPHLHPSCVESQKRECIERSTQPAMRVFVVRVADGVEVEDRPSWMPHYTDADRYWFTEGNMSCDCNRHLVFERAQDRDPDAEEVTCSSGLYRVRIEVDE